MQFIDLHKQYDQIKNGLDAAMLEVYKHKRFIMGPEVNELEYQLQKYTNVKHVIACASGTDALTISLMSIGLEKNEAVFVPSFSFFASAEAVTLAGGIPVFVDSDENTFNISADSLKAAIEKIIHEKKLVPKGVIAVDLFGLPADFQKIKEITKEYDLFLLEDAAQGFGGAIGKQKATSFGDIATTSFFPAKPLGCYGDGGAIFTNDDELADRINSIHIHGQGNDKYDNIRIGLNSRLDTVQAVVLLEKLKIFDQELELRNQIAEAYSNQLKNLFCVPEIPQNYSSSWAQYTLHAETKAQRDKIVSELKKKNIPVMVYYPIPIHCSTAYKKYGNVIKLPVCEHLSDTVFSLPMHPYLELEEVQFICDAVKKIVKE